MNLMDPGRGRPPRSAGIYCRLSYAPDGSLEKVERQEADCRELAQRLGWPVSDEHVYPDNSRSAWQRNRRRPAWDRMLHAIEAGEIDAILVYHGDRLIRQPYDLETLISIADQKGVRIASPSGTRDLSSADDRFILRIEAAQACREVDNTSRRVRRALGARAQRGLTQVGGRRPFGYGPQVGTRTAVKDGQEIEVPVYDTTQQVPSEARLGAEAVTQLLAGQSEGSVIRWLNKRCLTTEGNPWTTKALKSWLASPRIAGLIEHDGQLLPAVWDPIISQETWEDVKALMEHNTQVYPYRGRERVHLLTGIAECYKCERPVKCKPTGGRNRPGSRIYYCGACTGIGRSQAHLDRYVEGLTVRLLNDPTLAAELYADDGTPGLGAEIAELERRKAQTAAQLEELADHPEVDPVLSMRALASYDRKISELRSRMAATAGRRLLLQMIGVTPERWGETPVDVRSTVIRSLWRVVIRPATWRGPGFDPASVTVVRRSLSSL